MTPRYPMSSDESEVAVTSMLPPERPAARSTLSDREQHVADLLVQGLRNKEIADAMFLSPETIKGYVASILHKLGARNRVEATAILFRGGADDG
jgi:DNA-binding NarL/FixJ family response regulator